MAKGNEKLNDILAVCRDSRMTMRIHSIRLRMSIAYLIEGKEGLVLVDTGLRGEHNRILKEMNRIGRDDLRMIFITHAHLDHYGCAASLRKHTGAKIAIHKQDEEAMALGETRLGTTRNFGRVLKALLPLANPLLRPEPVQADLTVDDGDDLSRFGIEASILHTPGHTFGSSTLLLNNGIAFVGDLLTNSGPPRLQRFFSEDWALLHKSLARLQRRFPRSVYSGHGFKPIQSEEIQKLQAMP